jgi:hypothetical protein
MLAGGTRQRGAHAGSMPTHQALLSQERSIKLGQLPHVRAGAACAERLVLQYVAAWRGPGLQV